MQLLRFITPVAALLALILSVQLIFFPTKTESSTTEPPPAQSQNVALFSTDPISVSPAKPVVGQPVIFSAVIKNTTSTPGSYSAEISVNGQKVDSKVISVPALGSDKIVFQNTFPAAGVYTVAMGPQKTSIEVIENRVPVEVKIDNGVMDGCNPLAGSTGEPGNVVISPNGSLIKLTAPSVTFQITGVKIYGYIKDSTYDFNHNTILGGPGLWVYGQDVAIGDVINKTFTVNIYDSNKTRLFSKQFSKDLFTHDPGWVTVDIPKINVNGDFYIEISPYNLPRLNATGGPDRDFYHRYVVHTWYYQLCIGYQNAIDVQSWVSQQGDIVPKEYVTYNWLIRAVGY